MAASLAASAAERFSHTPSEENSHIADMRAADTVRRATFEFAHSASSVAAAAAGPNPAAAASSAPSSSSASAVTSASTLTCSLCRITVRSAIDYARHTAGAKHRKAAAKPPTAAAAAPPSRSLSVSADIASSKSAPPLCAYDTAAAFDAAAVPILSAPSPLVPTPTSVAATLTPPSSVVLTSGSASSPPPSTRLSLSSSSAPVPSPSAASAVDAVGHTSDAQIVLHSQIDNSTTNQHQSTTVQRGHITQGDRDLIAKKKLGSMPAERLAALLHATPSTPHAFHPHSTPLPALLCIPCNRTFSSAADSAPHYRSRGHAELVDAFTRGTDLGAQVGLDNAFAAMLTMPLPPALSPQPPPLTPADITQLGGADSVATHLALALRSPAALAALTRSNQLRLQGFHLEFNQFIHALRGLQDFHRWCTLTADDRAAFSRPAIQLNRQLSAYGEQMQSEFDAVDNDEYGDCSEGEEFEEELSADDHWE